MAEKYFQIVQESADFEHILSGKAQALLYSRPRELGFGTDRSFVVQGMNGHEPSGQYMKLFVERVQTMPLGRLSDADIEAIGLKQTMATRAFEDAVAEKVARDVARLNIGSGVRRSSASADIAMAEHYAENGLRNWRNNQAEAGYSELQIAFMAGYKLKNEFATWDTPVTLVSLSQDADRQPVAISEAEAKSAIATAKALDAAQSVGSSRR